MLTVKQQLISEIEGTDNLTTFEVRKGINKLFIVIYL